MRKFAYSILLGLVGAGIVHIAVLLLVPTFTEQNAWSRLADSSDLYQVTRVDAGGTPIPMSGSIDPLFQAAACRFDLADGVLHVHAEGRVPFWSVSVYNRSGHTIFSFNDRTAASGALDIVVLTSAQMLDVRKGLTPEFESSVFVEAEVDQGIVVVRSFVPDATWSASVSDFLKGVDCEAT